MKLMFTCLLMLALWTSCADQKEAPAAPIMQIVEIRDTIASFDPDTKIETMEEVISYDTLYVEPEDN